MDDCGHMWIQGKWKPGLSFICGLVNNPDIWKPILNHFTHKWWSFTNVELGNVKKFKARCQKENFSIQTLHRQMTLKKNPLERVGREVGGGIGMGKTCEPKAFSFQCMTKFTTNKKKKEKPSQELIISIELGFGAFD